MNLKRTWAWLLRILAIGFAVALLAGCVPPYYGGGGCLLQTGPKLANGPLRLMAKTGGDFAVRSDPAEDASRNPGKFRPPRTSPTTILSASMGDLKRLPFPSKIKL